jgi:hypothetical protein
VLIIKALIFSYSVMFTSNIIFTGFIDTFLNHYAVRLSCKMFRLIIIGFVLACAAAQFPYSIDEKIKCVIEYYLNKRSIGPYQIQKLS